LRAKGWPEEALDALDRAGRPEVLATRPGLREGACPCCSAWVILRHDDVLVDMEHKCPVCGGTIVAPRDSSAWMTPERWEHWRSLRGGDATKPVVPGDDVRTEENLPWRTVYYPGPGGTFFAFSPSHGEPLALCHCAKSAVRNYLTMKGMRPASDEEQQHPFDRLNPARKHLADSRAFPLRVTHELTERGVCDAHAILAALRFVPGLCHECNEAMPALRYCDWYMRRPSFSENFGWYTNKRMYEWGIYSIQRGLFDKPMLPECCPEDVAALFELGREGFDDRNARLIGVDYAARMALCRRWDRQLEAVTAAIENSVRERFGYEPRGAKSTGETMLCQVVRRLYPGSRVVRRYRPPFLGGMELDVFLPELGLALEYQGEQHYVPVPHFGGEAALRDLRARDTRKALLCRQAGIVLVAIRYDEPLHGEYVAARISTQFRSQEAKPQPPPPRPDAIPPGGRPG